MAGSWIYEAGVLGRGQGQNIDNKASGTEMVFNTMDGSI